MTMEVLQPGLLSLLQDSGRYGQQRIGLTTGGPLDLQAYLLCQRLLGNERNATAIEISFGGLVLQAATNTHICVTGASLALTINDQKKSLWQVHPVQTGDRISLGYTDAEGRAGCRSYLGVAGGFAIEAQFGSSATVVRESIGGIGGRALTTGDKLPCKANSDTILRQLPQKYWPNYSGDLILRLIPGYQQAAFSKREQQRFFSASYRVSERCDRMGYCLEGPAISCNINGILSEGICFGAVQIPADGQPIVLLNDRQTIGGYPKIGAVLSLDVARLAQSRPGTEVCFCPISIEEAHNALHLAAYRNEHLPLPELAPSEGASES
ncbi:MAG: biotin-dependent carboxyltransferase family protein [Parahaliea sp.]